jgi:hypothetical protein
VTLAATHAQAVAARRLIDQERTWRAQAQALAFTEPDPEIGRRHLLEFVRWSHRSYLAGWFHRELCAELERFSRDVAAGRNPRLLIAAPPRHGKSQIVSRAFPVWHLGNHPDHEVVVASYGQELANDMSRDARVIRDRVLEEPGLGWGHLAPSDKDGVEYWRTAGGGSYKAVGAGGPLTGRGAHVLVLDDLLKNHKEADSETVREDRWHWYTSTAYTRLAPGGGVLMMATRWHDEDPSGRALAQLQRGEEAWRVVSFPAVAEEDEEFRLAGEALHAERYDLERLTQIQGVLTPRQWAALYQQRPIPAGGNLLKPHWVRRYDWDPQRPPERWPLIVVTVDATFKKTTAGSFVSIQGWAIQGTKRFLLGEIHARMDYVELREATRTACATWHPQYTLVELKANGPALIRDLADEIPGLIGFDPDGFGDKMTRAQLSMQAWATGRVYLPSAEWMPTVNEYIAELLSFPIGPDDRMDAWSQLHLWLADNEALTRGNEEIYGALDALLSELGAG